MARGVKAAVAAMALLGATEAARADDTYSFNFHSNQPGILDIVG